MEHLMVFGWLALLAGSYLLGAVPFGVIIGRLKGVDPRTAGSGNIGATNVFRLLGPGPGLLVLALDILKGFAPTYAAGVLEVTNPLITYPTYPPQPVVSGIPPAVVVLVAVAAILGHSYSIFLGGKGGKSVATAGGAIIGLDWRVALFAAVFLIGALLLTRYVSVASTSAAAALPVGFFLFERGDPRMAPYLTFGFLVLALVIYKHWANYERLRAGTEPKFGRRA